VAVIYNADLPALLYPSEQCQRNLSEHACPEGALIHGKDDASHRRTLPKVEPFEGLQFQFRHFSGHTFAILHVGEHAFDFVVLAERIQPVFHGVARHFGQRVTHGFFSMDPVLHAVKCSHAGLVG